MSELNITAQYGLIIIQDLQIVQVDDTYARIYGYESADELLRETNSFLDLIDPAYHHVTYTNYQKLIDGTLQPMGRTYTNVDRNGRQFTVFTIDHVVQWNGRKAVQVTVIDMSIVEKATAHSNKRNLMYKKLITESAQAILIHRHFKPLMVNNTFVDAVQAESISDLLRGDTLSNIIFHSNDKNKLSQSYEAIFHGQVKSHKDRVQIKTFIGERRIFDIYSDYVEWENGPAVRSVFEDVTEQVDLKKQLELQAMTDHLSQLFNRHAIYKWLESKDFTHTPLKCALIDIDDFKSINDTFGHNTGDEAIKMISNVCKEIIGDSGIVGRWGGEEFIILSYTLSCSEMVLLVEKIRERCANTTVRYKEDLTRLTISVGVTDSYTACGLDFNIDKLIKDTDILLYKAKHSGKNLVLTSCKDI